MTQALAALACVLIGFTWGVPAGRKMERAHWIAKKRDR